MHRSCTSQAWEVMKHVTVRFICILLWESVGTFNRNSISSYKEMPPCTVGGPSFCIHFFKIRRIFEPWASLRPFERWATLAMWWGTKGLMGSNLQTLESRKYGHELSDYEFLWSNRSKQIKDRTCILIILISVAGHWWSTFRRHNKVQLLVFLCQWTF